MKDNDVFFALHAVLLTLVTLFQMIIYPHGPKPSPAALRLRHTVFTVVGVFTAFALIYGVYVWSAGERTGFASKYSYIVMLSLAKVVITLGKD